MAKITNVKVRMYCLGTGDCFILSFCAGAKVVYTVMIDCGSCKGDKNDFKPYLEDLVKFVKGKIDLLVITHEHNDHVNGFAKCPELFEQLQIDRAWFAWTENPRDPGGKAADLQEKRQKMRLAFANAMTRNEEKKKWINQTYKDDYYGLAMEKAQASFMNGLNTLADINLSETDKKSGSLPGMVKIKEILKKKKAKIEYLHPGTTLQLDELPGINFHVLGPPYDSSAVYKEGKQGTDVYKKNMALSMGENMLAVNLFADNTTDAVEREIPFADEYLFNDSPTSYRLVSRIAQQSTRDSSTGVPVIQAYNESGNEWRKIDHDWYSSAGTLALRLNSHINNTSLVLAIENDEANGKVLLFPGDAEYGSWESWHEIRKWKNKGKDGKHFTEDLLNRVAFYKVGHHLSYNGTALEKGIAMMEAKDMAAMATLDRKRIAERWKTTMPNKLLLEELIRKCKGKLFIMDETGIRDAPSKTLDPASLKTKYKEGLFKGTKKRMYIEYTCSI